MLELGQVWEMIMYNIVDADVQNVHELLDHVQCKYDIMMVGFKMLPRPSQYQQNEAAPLVHI